MNESRRFTLRIFRFLATQMTLGEPRWAVGFAKGKNSTAQPHRGRRFVCSEKPKDPQDEPAGFGLRDYGFLVANSEKCQIFAAILFARFVTTALPSRTKRLV